MAGSATIGGKIIKGPVAWAIQPGTAPYMTVIHVDKDEVPDPTALMGYTKAQTLDVSGIGGSWKVLNVYVVDFAPGGDPYTWALTLADRRFWWPRQHVLRRYNIRRRTGSMRLLTEGHPVLVPEAVSDFGYELATLNNGKRWEPKDAISDVFQIVDVDAPIYASSSGFTIPLDDLELDDDGASAVTRLLRMVPGCNVYVSAGGNTTIFDETDRAAAQALFQTLGSPVVGKGIVGAVSYTAIRPSSINALFTPEQELKFTSIQDGGTSYSTRGDTSKFMENVLESPDLSLTLTSGRTVSRGTWITLQEAIDAWGGISGRTIDGKQVDVPKLTVALIRLHWFNKFKMWIEAGEIAPDAVWVQRIAAVMNHFRQTYRISPYWMNRIRSIRPERVAILDTENGSRAPAFVTQNYAMQFGVKGIMFAANKQAIVANTTNVYNDSLALAKAAPFSVSVVNNDLGILHLSIMSDVTGNAVTIYPCALALDGIPQMSPAFKAGNPFTDGTTLQGAPPAMLAETHRVAIVVTCVPSAPNSNDQLYRVNIPAADVAASGGSGPVWEVRVGPGIATARFAWDDAHEDLIDKSFGVPANAKPGVRPTYANGDALAKANLLVDASETKSLAKAFAASIYSQMTDRLVGMVGVPGDGNLAPTGNATMVVHGLDAGGELNSIVRFDKIAGRLDVQAFIPNSTRRQLMRQVQP
jgi:hypothetical protein